MPLRWGGEDESLGAGAKTTASTNMHAAVDRMNSSYLRKPKRTSLTIVHGS